METRGDNHEAEQLPGRDEEGGWQAVDPGFSLPMPDIGRIDHRFYARPVDPERIDPGFHLRPPKRRSGGPGAVPPARHLGRRSAGPADPEPGSGDPTGTGAT